MSLDSLFEQIIVTEQQLSVMTKRFQEVKVATIRCQEKIKTTIETREKTKQKLDEKAQILSEKSLEHYLMKKQEDQLEKQVEELLYQQSQLKDHLDKIQAEAKQEEERFLEEITQFNEDFSLCANREGMVEDQTQSEVLDLENEAASLRTDMELMKQKNHRIHALQEEERTLQQEMHGLKTMCKDFEHQLSEAEAITESLRAESHMVRQKPLTDSTCLRLKKELELHKECELELLWETLNSEIQYLQSKVNNNQCSQQQ